MPMSANNLMLNAGETEELEKNMKRSEKRLEDLERGIEDQLLRLRKQAFEFQVEPLS